MRFSPVSVGSTIAAAITVTTLLGSPALAQDAFRFGTSWSADGERGGFYHGVATGIYKKYGLDVTIVPGGPQTNNPQLLAAGNLDGVMLGGMIEGVNYVKSGVPLVSVAAIYQRHPQVLIAHASQGYKTLADLKGKPIQISSLARNGYWAWLKSKFGYSDDQIRPYTFNLGNFVNDPTAIQQGYATWEPMAVKEMGVEATTFVMADAGYKDYTSLLTVRRETLEKKRDMVQRFVDASIESWYAFLYNDPAPAIALIKQSNPTITDALILRSRKALIDYGIVDSGDALTSGIGAMTETRWREWFAELVKAGLFEAGDKIDPAFDTSLVNKKVGMSLKN